MSFPSTKESQNDFGVPRSNMVTVRCTDDGTPIGNFNMAADYSVTPGDFRAVVPPGVCWYIHSVVVYMSGAGNVVANGYGTIAALVDGTLFQVETAAETPLIPPIPLALKTNGEFQEVGFAQDIQDTGPGINHVTFKQVFKEVIGVPLQLQPGQRFAIRPSDDLSLLTTHHVTIGGYALSILP